MVVVYKLVLLAGICVSGGQRMCVQSCWCDSLLLHLQAYWMIGLLTPSHQIQQQQAAVSSPLYQQQLPVRAFCKG